MTTKCDDRGLHFAGAKGHDLSIDVAEDTNFSRLLNAARAGEIGAASVAVPCDSCRG